MIYDRLHNACVSLRSRIMTEAHLNFSQGGHCEADGVMDGAYFEVKLIMTYGLRQATKVEIEILAHRKQGHKGHFWEFILCHGRSELERLEYLMYVPG